MNFHDRRHKTFSTAELSRKVGDVTHAASKAPVLITQHNKPRYVMMSVEDFAKIDPQKSYSVEDMPEHVLEWVLKGLEDTLSGKTPYEE